MWESCKISFLEIIESEYASLKLSPSFERQHELLIALDNVLVVLSVIILLSNCSGIIKATTYLYYFSAKWMLFMPLPEKEKWIICLNVSKVVSQWIWRVCFSLAVSSFPFSPLLDYQAKVKTKACLVNFLFGLVAQQVSMLGLWKLRSWNFNELFGQTIFASKYSSRHLTYNCLKLLQIARVELHCTGL